MRVRSDVTRQARARWLKAYALTGIIVDACIRTKIHRSTVYRWMEDDAAFVEAMAAARHIAAELTERELYRRAVEGVERTVYYQGVPVGVQREYSDTLLLAHARRLIPAYRETTSLDVRGQLKAQMEITVNDARAAARANLSPDELDRIARAIHDR